MARKGVLRGRKVNRRHSTVTDAAGPVIRTLKALPEVRKIVLGEVVHLPGGPRRLKCTPVRAGLRVTVRAGGSQQTLYVYTAVPGLVDMVVRDTWDGPVG